MLDRLGAEVSAKIREAIKVKLLELNVYVDEELPDYIMVMIVNQKTPQQMKDDLGLFLSDNTESFVRWLQDVLLKLDKVTLPGDGKAKKKAKADPEKKRAESTNPHQSAIRKEEAKKKVDLSQPRDESRRGKRNLPSRSRSGSPSTSFSSSEDRSPVTSWSRARQIRDDRKSEPRSGQHQRKRKLDHVRPDSPRRGRVSRRASRHRSARDSASPNNKEDARKLPADRRGSKDSGSFRGRSRSKERLHRREGSLRHSDHREGRQKPRVKSGIVVVKNEGGENPPDTESRAYGQTLASSIGAVISHNSDEEYDPEQMLRRSLVASRITVASRPSRPLAASKNLVMKAVAEADKSIISKRLEGYQPDMEYDVRRHRVQLNRGMTSGKSSMVQMEHRHHDSEGERQTTEALRLHDADLRHVLGKSKERRNLQKSNRAEQNPGYVDTRLPSDEENDPVLEKMRQRALESMLKKRRGQNNLPEPEKAVTPRKETTYEEAIDREPLLSRRSESDLSLSDDVDPSRDDSASEPTFIVTLDGIDVNYFKDRSKACLPSEVDGREDESDQGGNTNKSIMAKTGIVSTDPGRGTQSFSKNQFARKPEAKVAPLQAVQAKHDTAKSDKASIPHRRSKPESMRHDEKADISCEADKVEVSKNTSPGTDFAVKKPDVSALLTSKPSTTMVPQPGLSETTSAAEAAPTKPKRPRITAPEPDRPKPPTLHSPLTAVGEKLSRERCRYWPRCTRGDSCFYFHPKPRSGPASSMNKDRFRWTSASVVP